MIPLYDQAILMIDLPKDALKAGDVSVVVQVYEAGVAYDVEFFTLAGHSIAIITLEAHQVRAISSHDMLHARERYSS